MKEVVYNPAFMKVNDINLTKNESAILNEILIKDVVSTEELNKITGSRPGTRASTVTLYRLRNKVKGLIEIKNIKGAGYYIEDKSNITLEQGAILKPIQYETYRMNVEEYINRIFNDYKRDIREAEEILKERLGKIL